MLSSTLSAFIWATSHIYLLGLLVPLQQKLSSLTVVWNVVAVLVAVLGDVSNKRK
jgi:hypothetical protein